MNTIPFHITDNFGYRIPDTTIINSYITYFSAITEGLQGRRAYMEKIADFGRSHKVSRFLSTQSICQHDDHVAQKLMLVKDTVKRFFLN